MRKRKPYTRRRAGKKVAFDPTLKAQLSACIERHELTIVDFTNQLSTDENGKRFSDQTVGAILKGDYDGGKIGEMIMADIRDTIARLDRTNKADTAQPTTPRPVGQPIGHKVRERTPVGVGAVTNGNGHPTLTFPDRPIAPKPIHHTMREVLGEPDADQLQERALDLILRLNPAQLKKAVSLLGVIEKAKL